MADAPIPPAAPADPLARFSEATRAWFDAAFAAPTTAQVGAWDAIADGQHALVVAPTGSGKTLSAFLWSLDRLLTTPPPPEKQRRCRVLYVSPLKALAVDVERNLRAPLTGIRHTADRASGRGAARDPGRRPLRRHPGRRAPAPGREAPRHPDHHPRVAVPDADLPGAGDAARRRDGDRRRGARRGRRASAAPTSRSPSSGSTPPRPARRSGSGCPRRSARTRRWPGSWAARARPRSWLPRRRRSGTSGWSCRSRT